MEIKQYQALVTAIETGSLAAAAEKLGYTTSGMSRIIASLEEDVGKQLLIRSKKGVRPSQSCEQILPEIYAMLRSAETLRLKESALHGKTHGTIRIGTAYIYFYPMLAQCISEFHKEYPDVIVKLVSGYSSQLSEMLVRGELDLCIISRRKAEGDWTLLTKDEMVAVVSDKNPLAKRTGIRFAEFTHLPCIITLPDTDSDSLRLFRKYGIEPNVLYTTQDSMATHAMVQADLGVTTNNRINVRMWMGGGIRTIPLKPRQQVEIGIAGRSGAGKLEETFRKLLVEAYRDMPPQAQS